MFARNRIVIGLWLLVAPSLLGCAHESARPRPNALVICVDVLRADHVGSYGYRGETSPSIDSLARSGAVFESAFSAAAWTKPSVPSYFTGRFPHQHGVYLGSREQDGRLVSDVLRPEEKTLAELFKVAGYRTFAVVANPTIRAGLGFGQGFDTYAESNDERAEAVRTRFLDWLDQSHREGPFFAYVHFNDVHLPYDPPPAYRPEAPASSPGVDFSTAAWKLLKRGVRDGTLALSDADRRAMIDLYDAEIRYTDAQIGELIAALTERGLHDDTLVVVLSDHGEELLDHGGVDHGSTLYDELVHVPLIMRFPRGEAAGVRVAQPVSLVDLLPTLAQYFSLEVPAGLAGRSILPLARQESAPGGQALYSEGIHPAGYQQAVRVGEWKYIVTVPVERVAASTSHELLGKLTSGLRVEVKGIPTSPDGFVAETLEIKEDQADAREEVTGLVEAIDLEARTLRVQGYTVRLEPGCRFENAAKERIEPSVLDTGTLIKAYGRALSSHELSATKIGTRDPAARKTYGLEGKIAGAVRKAGEATVFQLVGREVHVGKRASLEQQGREQTVGDAQTADPWLETKDDPSLRKEELYHLADDPGEHRNLAALELEKVAAMRSLLTALRNGSGAQAAPTRPLEDRDEEALRALGYLE